MLTDVKWDEEFAPRVARLLDEEASPEGRLISRRQGVVVHARKVPNMEAEIIRAVGVIEGISATQLYRALWDVQRRKQWDTGNVTEWQVVRQFDENNDMHYIRVSGMFGMADRDFCDVRHRCELPDGSYAILFRSFEHPEVPKAPPAVRADTIFSGQVIRPLGVGRCRVTACNQTDIKGSIPPYLVNKASARAPADWFSAVRATAHILEAEYHDKPMTPPLAPAPSSTLPMAEGPEGQEEHVKLLGEIEQRLKRCDRAQLLELLQGLAMQEPELLPVVAAGVSTSAAQRAETEELILQMLEYWQQIQQSSADTLMVQDAFKELPCHQLVELSNNKVNDIVQQASSALQNTAEGSDFALLALLELHAQMQIQVNDYTEAIHLQALAKAHAIDNDVAIATEPMVQRGVFGRLSHWWYGNSSAEAILPPAGEPENLPAEAGRAVPASSQDTQIEVGEEDVCVNGLQSLQSVALRLNKKLELTTVKKLIRLSKYKSFSAEELNEVSNGHILMVAEQIKRVKDKVSGWSVGENIFSMVEGTAELCLQVNDYAEAVNYHTTMKMRSDAK